MPASQRRAYSIIGKTLFYLIAYNNRLLIDNEQTLFHALEQVEEYVGFQPPLETLVVESGVKLLRVNRMPRGLEQVDLRASLELLNDDQYRWVSRAQQLLHWRLQHQHCGRCGATMEQADNEMALVCTGDHCRNRVYPRISPCIIVLVEHEDRALLAHNSRFTPNRFSTLAGFIEAGESVERAVAREIREEVGVEVDGLRYFNSQAWPFPDSLMLAFHAQYAGGEIQPDGDEITEARWFTVEELESVDLPPPFSISRQLIDDWVERQQASKT